MDASPEGVKKVFNEIDTGNKGYVEKDQLSVLFQKLNCKLDDASISNLFVRYDTDKNGKLELDQFGNLVKFLTDEIDRQKKQRAEATKTSQTASAPAGTPPASSNTTPSASAPASTTAAGSKSVPAQSTAAAIAAAKEKRAPTRGVSDAVKSKYEKIAADLRTDDVHHGEDLYVDKEFPANDSVLPKAFQGKGVVWKRPSEISPAPQLFENGTEEGDVKQGQLGDCWFLGALSVLAHASGSELIQHLFVATSFEKGRHKIRFYKDFEWIVVDIDDLLPCHGTTGNLLFAKCLSKNEFWVPLVEKAYAKLHGSYPAIEAGAVINALKDLTGEGVEVVDLKGSPNKDELWKMLVHNIQESFLMGCAVESTGPAERKLDEGLLVNHAYSIIDCQEFQGHKLLRIRNPWGEVEWQGAWSDGAKEWTPEVKAHFNYEFANDGTFFMSFDDFLRFFTTVHVLRLLTDDVGEVWKKYVFRGEWKGNTAGGCTNHPTWHKNPQYSFVTKNPKNSIFMCLSQPDNRYAARLTKAEALKSYQPIGVLILAAKEHEHQYKRVAFVQQEVVSKSVFSPRRDFSFEFQANPGFSYIIIPTTFDPKIEMPYELSIYTQKEGTLKAGLGKTPRKKVKSEWEGKTAGGCPNFPTWKENPQFLLSSSKDTTATISLVQKKTPEAAGFSVFNSGERVTAHRNAIFKPSSFTNAPVISGEVKLTAGKPVVIVPATFEPGKKGHFSVVATSEDPTSLSLASI